VAGLPDIVKRFLAWLLAGKPPYLMVAPKLFRFLRRQGIPVWFLGVNTEAELHLAVQSGASAILTDKVSYITKLVREQDLRFAKVAS
jgi:glycerophosphoryl diester phosphodiesterase